jgi:hypothetical protein
MDQEEIDTRSPSLENSGFAGINGCTDAFHLLRSFHLKAVHGIGVIREFPRTKVVVQKLEDGF